VSISILFLTNIIFYHLKNYFINYIIPFYNIPKSHFYISYQNQHYLFIYSFFDFFLSSSPSLSLSILFVKSNNIENHNYKHIAQTQLHTQTKKNQNLKKKTQKTRRNILHIPINPPPSRHQTPTTITKLQIPTTRKNNDHHHCQLSTTIT